MKINNIYRKINIFYADDLAENIINLLDGLKSSGLFLFSPRDIMTQLKTTRVDSNDVYDHNKNLLNSDRCLINLDYSTRINDSIDKIRINSQGFDLVICDLYFGEGDKEFKDSKIGGMWIILWAKQRAKTSKIVCKLYSGQADLVSGHIDFKKAEDFLLREHFVKVEQVQKFRDPSSWREQLAHYLTEVSANIISDIEMDDRINFLNLLSQSFKCSTFNNLKEKDNIKEFRNKFGQLENYEFNLIDGRKIKLTNLFPILIGKRFLINDKDNFNNLDEQELENILYTNELEFKSKEAREKKIKDLQQKGIAFNLIKKHDMGGNPIYGLKMVSEEYNEGLIAKLERQFINSLDSTYQIYNFFHQQKGFGIWSRSSAANPMTTDEFNKIRNEAILPFFARIKDCFKEFSPVLEHKAAFLDDQIETAIRLVDETEFSAKRALDEQKLEHGFLKLEKEPLFDQKSKHTIIPLKSMFRINIIDFLKSVLNLQEGVDYSNYEDTIFQKIKTPPFYWYCNAYRVRKGLKEIKKNMEGDHQVFYLLESTKTEKNPLIQYKIILKDFGKGIPSIARKFSSIDKSRFLFDQYLKGFCQLTIRSKMAGFEGISLNVFTGKDDIPCAKIKKQGTEFEIQFTQGKER